MWDWVKTALDKFGGPMFAFFASAANPLVAIIMIVYTVANLVVEMTGEALKQHAGIYDSYTSFMQAVGSSVFGQFPPAIASPLGFINAFIPLTEMLILVGLASVFYMLALAFRIIKSWIPTVN